MRGQTDEKAAALRPKEVKEPGKDTTPSPGPTLQQALDQLAATLGDLAEERGGEPIWASMLKPALKRQNPGFNERAHGFKSFNELLQAAEKHHILTLEKNEKLGQFSVRPVG